MSACLLVILMPVASAACLPIQPVTTVTPYIPPGPHGTIYVESSPPGAVISLNGDTRGRAPVNITGLWPGSYTITTQLSGYQDYTATTSISGATISSVYCPMVPDNSGNGLYIISNPSNGIVYLDGKQNGVTPILLSSIAAGTHTIQIRLYGYDEWKSTVDFHEGGTKTITANLNQEDNDLDQGINVSSSPGGAKVMLDGLAKGITPITLNNVAAGIHILQIDYPGYTSWKSTIDVPETGIQDIAVTLKGESTASPGWITVSSGPGNASVMLDGSYVGRTQSGSFLDMDTISPGEHTVALELPGYQPYSTQAIVSPGQVCPVNATLQPLPGPGVDGALSVTSDPAGATVSVDNISLGISPVTVDNIADGDHMVTLTKDGYRNYSDSIAVTAGTTSIVSATLVPVTRSLHTPVSLLAILCALGITGFLILRKPA